MTVVICAYNAAPVLDQCLSHTCALSYPDLEILVVDDGSSDATASIAAQHPRARVLRTSHAGLSGARNVGLSAATGQVIAYLDSDAYPTPEWPFYLALGMDGPAVRAVGGPNVPPVNGSRGAYLVARAPGGPAHVLVSDERAEHIPGCNMAFWREALLDCGGFDPIFTSAGDDVDLCWRFQERGWEIGFHPAALVWHHRRNGLLPYLRQQLGYGRSEALVEARHPDRFTAWGSARWRGVIYDAAVPSVTRQRIYRGQFGAATFQSVYQGGGHLLDVVHQAGVPIAVVLLFTGLLGFFKPVLASAAITAALALLVLAIFDVVRLRPPPRSVYGGLRYRLGLTAMHLLQPVVRSWGRSRHRAIARQSGQPGGSLPGPMRYTGGAAMIAPFDGSRAELAAAAVNALQLAGLPVSPGSGWEDFDGRLSGGLFVLADLVTSDHPKGWVQLRIRRGLRWRAATIALAVTVMAAFIDPLLSLILFAAVLVETCRGLWCTGSRVRRVLVKAAA
jgi:hypothetical protein